MGKHRTPGEAASTAFNFYRITPNGRAIAARESLRLRSRYLSDLLDVLDMCGRGVPECELRQFMPPASLGESICALLELGLIERDDAPPPRPRPDMRPTPGVGVDLRIVRLSPL